MSVSAMARGVGSWWGGVSHARRVTVSATLVVVAAGTAFVGVSGPSGASALASAIMDPASVLAGRSPGARYPGALYQTKPARGPAAHVRTHVRTSVPPAVPGLPVITGVEFTGDLPTGPAFVDPFPPGGLTLIPSGPSGVGGYAGGFPGGGGGFIGGSIGGGFNGGGGGGILLPVTGGGGGIVTPPPGTVTPVTPVPEPATWMTMIIGFAMVGAALRGRPRTALA